MNLDIDDDVAAFGTFQLVYSALDERISGAVLQFAHATGEQIGAQCMKFMKFGQKVAYLKRAIKPLKSRLRPNPLSEDLAAMAEAFNNIDAVQKWRNDRAHARVVFRPGIVLVDERGRPLRIKKEDCLKQIDKAGKAIIALEANTRDLRTSLNIRRRLTLR